MSNLSRALLVGTFHVSPLETTLTTVLINIICMLLHMTLVVLLIFLCLVAREFCRISLEFILKGSNPKIYQTAARKFFCKLCTVDRI